MGETFTCSLHCLTSKVAIGVDPFSSGLNSTLPSLLISGGTEETMPKMTHFSVDHHLSGCYVPSNFKRVRPL